MKKKRRQQQAEAGTFDVKKDGRWVGTVCFTPGTVGVLRGRISQKELAVIMRRFQRSE